MASDTAFVLIRPAVWRLPCDAGALALSARGACERPLVRTAAQAWPKRAGVAASRLAAVAGAVAREPVRASTVLDKEKVKVTIKENVTDKGKMYRLYILNDPFNTREFVIQTLLKVIPTLTFSRAYAAMQTAHETGQGLVIISPQEMAEHYCSQILAQGIFSTVTPDE
ncbi:ATP-dependent Clp protease adapter protein CLPS1, chloroplastic [Porphyridium purpureum]|uniref:ATP-dependent Clp protease adapter protein CLPS1, chloroplastic n=1 Tax=Porphyridium purpureum TaxID=35688 RepID=A0A5J4YNL5_PORPP|nr:ATP-dependent Clp protease adapter protein CLPS1, chloroplastic [Porphyridium purpureum]|eukprot:POR5124..scf244_11